MIYLGGHAESGWKQTLSQSLINVEGIVEKPPDVITEVEISNKFVFSNLLKR